MDRDRLKKILSSDYNREQWIGLLESVFHTGNVFASPQQLPPLPGDLSKQGYRLGTFDTSGGFRIGVFEVHLKENVALHRNRVGVRNLLRRYYKQLDGVFAVFKQGESWRFSFISQLRDWDEEHEEWVEKETEPKRFTYLLGKGEAVKTATDRFYRLVEASTVSFEDIKEAFSVEKLNKEFYKKVVSSFYDLLGVKEPGRGGEQHPHLLKLPSVSEDSDEGKKIHQEFAVRLIGRTIFCWFLKFKKSEQDNPIITEEALSSDAITEDYYHQKLERLFFQVLNTQKEDRRSDLPEEYKEIPFLNGGLFEPHTNDFFDPNDDTGISKHLNTLVIPDHWFKKLFEVLEQYNFTIDENSVEDADVSVDPEMLGRIFENLLAEINPESEESARKATGSYYTPREVVDYMVDESLNKHLSKETGINERRLLPLFKFDAEVEHSITEEEKEQLINALNNIKVLDPACGSGAFPMGVLQKVVRILEKIDQNSKRWKELQLAKIPSQAIRRIVRKRLDAATVEYARKLGIIQHSIYGVDIQPIAAEISKLRCFLSLVVDEQVDETKDNWNIEPLPNLEFKFLAADSLRTLPQEDSKQVDLFGSDDLLTRLSQIRDDYLQAYGEDKEILKDQFSDVQDAIMNKEVESGGSKSDRAIKLSAWEPFEDGVTHWFDPQWMFGVEQFDVVLGNPPYGGDKIDNSLKKEMGLGSKDPYGAFIARFLPEGLEKSPLADEGLLCLIVSDTFMTIKTHYELREMMMDNYIHKMIRVHKDTFGATVNTAIILCERNEFPQPDDNGKPVRKFDESHTCLMADLTQVSIHKQHERFLQLLEKTVQYEHPLAEPDEENADEKDGVLYMADDHWTSESSEEYAIYTYPQALINRNSNKPFFVASPKLFSTQFNDYKQSIRLNGKQIEPVKFGDDYSGMGKSKDWLDIGLFKVISGIKTGGNKKYLKTIGNAQKNYPKISLEKVLSNQEIKQLSKEEKKSGISGEKTFVPFEMGMPSNTDDGVLPCYYQKDTNIVINWSEESVESMYNESHSDLANEKFRFREVDKQISFSFTGQYCPTFRIANAPIFLNAASRIFLGNDESREFWLGFLNSKMTRFLVKNYINHTVNFGIDDVKDIHVINFSSSIIIDLVRSIMKKQKDDIDYDFYSNEQIVIDRIIFEEYNLTKYDIREIENWYARRYSKLVEAQKENLAKEGKPTDYLELYEQLEEEEEITNA